MGNVTLFVLALAALSFVLGFVALLSSRIYINPNTKAKLAVDLPILGKMQTNHPAPIFVFVGAALAFLAMEKGPRDTSWTIAGELREPSNQIKDWRNKWDAQACATRPKRRYRRAWTVQHRRGLA
jgi:hypothetical protein